MSHGPTLLLALRHIGFARLHDHATEADGIGLPVPLRTRDLEQARIPRYR